jgi:hypothetical protein
MITQYQLFFILRKQNLADNIIKKIIKFVKSKPTDIYLPAPHEHYYSDSSTGYGYWL